DLDCVDDVRVSAASAQVAGHEFSNLAVRTGVTFVDTGDSRHDLTRSAIAALEPVTFNEGRLHRMQFVALRQAFDGGDLFPLRHDGKRQTGENPPSIEMNGAGTASAMVAS